MHSDTARIAELPSVTAAEAQLDGLGRRLRDALDCEGQFETDRAGVIVWMSGEPIAEIGESLVRSDGDERFQAALARCQPFRDLDNGGGWHLSAVPYFETGSGRFLGYRGSARRAPPVRHGTDRLLGPRRAADTFASMAHEARTPLSAILGFAQMIEAETVGAAPAPYRANANAIIENAGRLLDAVDDLAAAAQLEQGRYPIDDGTTDLGAFLGELVGRYAGVAERRGVTLTALGGDGGMARIEERLLTRACDRLVNALLSVAEDESVLLAATHGEDGTARILMSRPTALAGLAAAQLLDRATRIPVTGGSILGFGFALCFAKALLEAAGGVLAIEPDVLCLTIPGIVKNRRVRLDRRIVTLRRFGCPNSVTAAS